MMSLSQARGHQDLILELAGMLRDFLKDKPCKPVVAPYDVKFDDSTVVQPDITVWCVRVGESVAEYYPSGQFTSEKLAGFSFGVEEYFKAATE